MRSAYSEMPNAVGLFFFPYLLAQIALIPNLFYLVQLRFEPINVLFFVLQQSFK
jgi:hypothetical protein